MPLIDLSHVIEHGMTTYPGLPGPVIEDHLSFEDSHDVYEPGTEFTIARIGMVADTGTGTYLDAPAHRYRDGHDLAGLALDRCVGLPAIAIAVGDGAVDVDLLEGHELAGTAVLLNSGLDRHWRTERYGDPPHPVVEHLTNLSRVPSTGARFTAVPPAIRGLATFRVRAFATVA